MTKRHLGRVGVSGDGWVRLTSLAGWDAHSIEVLVESIDGVPEITGIRLEPRTGEPTPAPQDRVLSANRLRRLPMQHLAHAAMAMQGFDLAAVRRELSEIANQDPHRPHHRSRTTPEQVASIYLLAMAAGLPPRAEVMRQLHISERTADRYIAMARRAEPPLLAPYRKESE